MTWTRVECAPLRHPTDLFGAACALTEGDEQGEHHTHWVDDATGVEVVVAWHAKGTRPKPNCLIRRPGVN
jgi:hypothetical protein